MKSFSSTSELIFDDETRAMISLQFACTTRLEKLKTAKSVYSIFIVSEFNRSVVGDWPDFESYK